MDKGRILGKIFGIGLVLVMLGSFPNYIIAASEKTSISVTDSSPWFTKGTNSGLSTWYLHSYNRHSYISTYVGGMPSNRLAPDGWAQFNPYLSQASKYAVFIMSLSTDRDIFFI